MKIFAGIAAGFGVLSLAVVAYLFYLGMANEINIEEVDLGPYWLVSQEQTGDYSKTFDAIEEVKNELKTRKVTPYAGAAIYYSDPAEVPIDQWKSSVGAILQRDDNVNKEEKAGQWELKEIPFGRYMKASFPYHNMMSVHLSILRVYPVLNQYLADKGYKRTIGIEIYKDDEILILMPIQKD